ncbi:glycoside hydrolase family 28 protein [Chryseobacterium sp. Ch-15]|uniref:Glycoside hydrolase family 28 protein n=1 Tax=Chryseobacterium muglaense TaxID=2893752 RepID=A0A9Q3YRU1_9FLAO|nr:glycoside hydrolase family 28 protein [Chryseobacterium muglaense]MBD3903496.1 right-handed parallel beta-helix repeat-containing protein [Chryseobacterium muglaense]MCC9034568.1 glycoside hydrolase family 28 protein [Chryseobacterium muglaense]MCM2552831.1 glycoside hydrolase family 28 protein [Chryseobacterium muglaense]
MKKSFKIISLAAVMLFSGQMYAQNKDIYTGIEFKMPQVKETSFPANTVSIKDFGGVAGGKVKNTDAFKKAIDALVKKGGGKLVVPRGMWLTGPIVLQSNINLHIEEGAFVVFSKDKNDYPLVDVSFEGLETIRCQSPISAKNAKNIAITGKGVIDGSGDAWRAIKKSKMAESQWKEIVKSGGILSKDGKNWYPSESYKKGFESSSSFNVPDKISKSELESVKDFLRPVMVSIVGCDQVLLDGPTFQNSPAWNLHPLMTSNLILRNLTVRNPWYSQNGDGVDLESCKNVLIYDNTFDVGDDAICIKSGKNEDGRKRGMPTENVIIKNNVVYHGHGGFVIGSEMSGGARNIHVSDCTFIGTDIGLRFKTTRGRGGVVENIYVKNIDMINIPTQTIGFNMFYEGASPVLEDGQKEEGNKAPEKVYPVTEETPIFRNIYFKNINAVNSDEAITINGLAEMNIKNIVIEDSQFDTKKALTIVDADGITLKNVKLTYSEGTGAVVYNSKNVDLSTLQLQSSQKPTIKVLGNKTSAVKLPKDVKGEQLSISKEVAKNSVK